ncbi:putative rna-directed rna polymerase (sad-1) [Phaeomoniella chlamydospora]|uniref:RNA-directed RNA polymerase n=1 Tax=Phaeomoniella chlamydospora TaxID=158046 RepID=A0A0G2EF68_PHACM|nr:putative rna-directed rna polymerase (sad-1) [Phaeomoniella chlamydospora]
MASNNDACSPRGPRSSRYSTSLPHLRPAWHDWDVLDVRVSGLPESITTYDLWNTFQNEGQVDNIEIFVNSSGRREGTAKIRFKPPPKRNFLLVSNGRYAINTQERGRPHIAVLSLYNRQQQVFEVKSPVREGVTYRQFVSIDAESLDFGVLKSPSHMLLLSNRQEKEDTKVKFSLNLSRKELYVNFPAITAGRLSQYRLQIPMEQLEKIFQVSHDDKTLSFIISLKTPPHFYRMYANVSETHTEDANIWRECFRWFRQTDIEATKEHQETRNILPVDLKQTRASIKLGRWTAYRLKFSDEQVGKGKAEQISSILQDHNIQICRLDDFQFSKQKEVLWDLIDDRDQYEQSNRSVSLEQLMNGSSLPLYPLSFDLRYALEVCISNNFLNEYNIGEEFIKRLCGLPEAQAIYLLDHVAQKKVKFYDAMEVFKVWQPRQPPRKPRLPKNCFMMRSVIVTPTTIQINEPTVEVTNRVIREYQHHADRFLRVRFEDDEFRGMRRIHGNDGETMNEVYTRVHRTLSSGIIVGGRRYEFLAYGNSQLREHGAYFFSSSATLSAASIRAWMGTFDHEKIIAKHAARIGQCFSTTKAVRGARVELVRKADLVPDIERNGYTFTDGVGKISPFLANMVSMELNIKAHAGGSPSAYQFRLGGCKGVLVVTSPEDRSVKWNGISLRKSQYKFDSTHHGLEIIRHSEFWGASLNRQLILVLSALGVEDEVFLRRQEQEIKGLKEALQDDATAISKLYEFVDPNHAVAAIANVVTNGFRSSGDPFTISMLRLWRAWRTRDLKSRAKLKIQKGACLLGCIDETATLRGHFDTNQPGPNASHEEKVKALPEIFLQVSRLESPGTVDVIEGICLLTRNPALHPGDIRVVKAVNAPQLKHVKDLVVLPQTGDRDLSGMCSGGDLDGDDYLVIWDQEYLPKIWNHAPMDYTAPPPKTVATNVTPSDIMRFFVQYMKNDILGRIAYAHLAWADYLDEGINSKKCLELAALHSKAVDYPKTGQAAIMDLSLNPRLWPHFMQKKSRTYRSQKILGRLFDGVDEVAFVPDFQGCFDDRILSSYPVDQKLLDDAAELKESYDEHVSRIMALHEIKTEHEVFSTLCLDHSQATKDYKFHEELGRLSSVLKEQFRGECKKRAGGDDFEHLAPFAVAMYKVTEAQVKTALAECKTGMREMKPDSMPFITFPWILQPILCEIASKQHQRFATTPTEEDPKPTKAENEMTALNGTTENTLSEITDVDQVKQASSVGSHSKSVSADSDLPIGTRGTSNHTEEQRAMRPDKIENRLGRSQAPSSSPPTNDTFFPIPRELSEPQKDAVPQLSLEPPIYIPKFSDGVTTDNVTLNTNAESGGSFSAASRRRRRLHGSGSRSSSATPNPDIEALLEQSDRLLEQRRRSRDQSSDGSFHSASSVQFQYLTNDTESASDTSRDVYLKGSNGLTPDLKPTVSSYVPITNTGSFRTINWIDNKSTSNTNSICSAQTAPEAKTSTIEDKEKATDTEEFVPTQLPVRPGRTALEQLAQMVARGKAKKLSEESDS